MVRVIAFGVVSDERRTLEETFGQVLEGRAEPLHCLDVRLNQDTAPTAAGHEVVVTSVNDEVGAGTLRVLAEGGTRFVAQRSTGYNNIDLNAAQEFGVGVARVSFYSPYSVAEFAWGLALAVNRRIVRSVGRTREFDFRLDGLMGRDFHGKTVGVLGTGKIGEAFSRIAHGFGMELLGHDLTPNPACEALGMRYVAPDELFSAADLVSLHLPLLPQTHHVVGAESLARMKDDAILVNSSRGGLIDTNALIDVLRRGRLHGVGLDVYEEEARWFHADRSSEVMTDDTLARLMTFNNVLVTAHQAYYTRDAVGQIVEATVRNVDDYLHGRTSDNVLSPAAERPRG